MAGDPRRGMFPTGQELIDDPNVFTTRIGGATDGVSPELLNIIGNSTEQMVGPGAEIMVTSGLRPGSRGSQHSAGQAADFGVRMPGRDAEGRLVLPGMDAVSGRERLNYSSPEIFDIARMAVSDGASGIGIGPTYMGGDVFHFDTGRGGASAPNFGETVRTWSDWNTSGPRGASDPMGAGDPSYGFRQELQGIRDAREMPVGGALTASAGAPSPQPVSATTGAMPTPQGMPQIGLQQFAEIMGNPYATDGQRAVAQALMQQQMQAADPLRQLQLQQAQLELEQARAPRQQAPIEVGGVLLDPVTYQPIFDSREPPARLIVGAEAEAMGLPPGAYNMRSDGTVTAIGGGGVTIENNMGPDAGPYLYGSDAGMPAGWRVNTETGVASPVPNGPADLEASAAAAAQERGRNQASLRMTPTLESINLNIAAIEGGGLPVAGLGGDFRRTTLGRALTGDSAVDFANRTNQITDSAALAELQHMRANSPTGGAVGNLTDSERVAIGNAITALNSSTSPQEYVRAARAYRTLFLDLAYGEGAWSLSDEGDLTVTMPPQPQAPSPVAGGLMGSDDRPRAVNPQTGETVEWDGSQWVPVQ
jgi:hypothetical protein